MKDRLQNALDMACGMAPPSRDPEEAAFEAWWKTEQLRAWRESRCHIDRGPEPTPAWASAFKPHAGRAWMARAAKETQAAGYTKHALVDAARRAVTCMDGMLRNGEWYEAQKIRDELDAATRPGVSDSETIYRMNHALCDFAVRWVLDGDYLRCKKCKRPHIASAIDRPFEHAEGCKLAATAEEFPWQSLLRILRPIYQGKAPETLKPLTPFERTNVLRAVEKNCPYPTREAVAFDQGMRACEAAHGIKSRE